MHIALDHTEYLRKALVRILRSVVTDKPEFKLLIAWMCCRQLNNEPVIRTLTFILEIAAATGQTTA